MSGLRGLLLLGLFASGAGNPLDGQSDPALRDLGFVLGATDAPLEIVEFADFACSACAEFARDTWPEVKRRYVDSGMVRWRMIPFELGFRNSEEGLRAAWCAARDDAFWPMHDMLYDEQDSWANERRPEDDLVALATSIGLDEASFRACWASSAEDDDAKRANRAARAHGVRGTPTFLIGDVVLQGAHPVQRFRELIEGRHP